MGHFSEIGHYIRLEPLASHQPLSAVKPELFSKTAVASSKPKAPRVLQPQFQFRFDYYSHRFFRELRNP
jgi:hypothetical protein